MIPAVNWTAITEKTSNTFSTTTIVIWLEMKSKISNSSIIYKHYDSEQGKKSKTIISI